MTVEAVPWAHNPHIHEIPTTTIRPIQPEDANLLYAMHERLSLESIYARYLHYRRPHRDEMAHMTMLPPERGAAMIATVQDHGLRIIGIAYYVYDTNMPANAAELGMLVEDDYQGLGIGRLLCFAIGQRARALKVEQLRVRFHPSNYRVLRMIQSSGYRYQAGMSDGLNDFTIFLKSEQGGSFLRQLWRRAN